MPAAYRPYHRRDPHSFVVGVFACLEAMATAVPLEALIVPQSPQANDGLDRLLTTARAHHLRIIHGDRLLQRLSGKGDCRAIAVYRKHDQTLAKDHDHVVLVDPADMGNLGTIMRTMCGFGIHDLAIIGQGADHHHPRVVRAAMGASFHLRIQVFPDHLNYLRQHDRAWYPFISHGLHPVHEIAWKPPASLIFGNESSGLGPFWEDIGTPVRIPHTLAIDSLNLALAVGIALYEYRRPAGA